MKQDSDMKYDRNAEEIVITDGTVCIKEKTFYGFTLTT